MTHPSDQVNGQGEPSAAWKAVAVLLHRWRVIAGATGLAVLLAVVVALTLPRDYAAEARVLRPTQTGLGMLLGLNEGTPGALGRLLGGGGGDYSRYLAILHSRSLREEVVNRFDLMRVYGVTDASHPMEVALQRLDRNLAFPVSIEFGHLSVVAYDREAERAAAMANFIVEELNRRHSAMTSDNARLTRVFIEQRLSEARRTIDSLQAAMQAFQERHGVVELESQAQAFMTVMAAQSARIAELEIRYRTLLQQYGPDHPQVIAARNAGAAARQQLQGALGGSEAVLPLALRDMPAASRQYAHLLQELLIQRQVMETIYPLFEQARFQEMSETRAVQVLDHAVVPAQPARPSRRLIVLVTAISAVFAAAMAVLAQHWVRENRAHLTMRLRRPVRSEPRRAEV